MKPQLTNAQLDMAQQQVFMHLKAARFWQPLLESSEVCNKLARYSKLLLEKNQYLNLTAITEPEAIAYLHFIDSLSMAPYFARFFPLEQKAKGRWIDVGTGAGFPGMVIQMIDPWGELTLLDSLQKRIAFLEEVKMNCRVQHVHCVHARAEDAGQNPEYREKYDLATARAVANLATLSELCLPFVRLGGYFVAMKGPNDETETARSAIQRLGGKVVAVDKFILPYEKTERSLIVIEKRKSTPAMYPRKAGLPVKKPL